jgi:hypothetical protein
MSVKVSKLWGNNKFNNLTNISKLFYIYLVTNPSINTVGVLSLNLKVVEAQLTLTMEQIRDSTKELISNGYLYVKQFNSAVYFIVPAHFNTLAKSDSTILKITKDLEALPDGLRDFLNTLNINTLSKARVFVKPTKKEVLDYSTSNGYTINADSFINYYQSEADKRGRSDVWINSRGKVVRDWKATLRNVWFKDENKLKECKGAPKGFEHFYIELKGKSYSPDFWKNNLPQSKDFLISKELQKEYERISK